MPFSINLPRFVLAYDYFFPTVSLGALCIKSESTVQGHMRHWDRVVINVCLCRCHVSYNIMNHKQGSPLVPHIYFHHHLIVLPIFQTAININMNVHYKSDEFFKDPHIFRPDRWMRGNEGSSINPFILIPFGHGTRSCTGMHSNEQKSFFFISNQLLS